jgi:hypothetical protein
MNKQQISDKIKDLEAEIKKLKEAMQGRKLKPDMGEKYWVYCVIGRYSWSVWDSDSTDLWRLSQGNVFKTEADADKYIEIYERYIELTDGWVPDYRDGTMKYCIDYNWGQDKVYSWPAGPHIQSGLFPFPLPDMRDKFRKEFGDDLKVAFTRGW